MKTQPRERSLDSNQQRPRGTTPQVAMKQSDTNERKRADSSDGPTPRRAVVIVLDDARPGGLDRMVLIERAAEIARTTRADVVEALDDLRRRGEVYDFGTECKLAPSRDEWGRR